MRELFFKDEKWTRHRRRRLHRHVPAVQLRRDRTAISTGTFASELAGVNDYRFPDCTARCDGRRHGFDVWNAGSKFYGGDAKFTYGIKPFGAGERADAPFRRRR